MTSVVNLSLYTSHFNLCNLSRYAYIKLLLSPWNGKMLHNKMASMYAFYFHLNSVCCRLLSLEFRVY